MITESGSNQVIQDVNAADASEPTSIARWRCVAQALVIIITYYYHIVW